MKKAIAIALVVVALVAAGFAQTATATHSLGHLIRQVNRLEAQVRILRADTSDLLRDVFDCTFIVGEPQAFTDGSFGYEMAYDAACYNAAAPTRARR